jgi:hypothetical protein
VNKHLNNKKKKLLEQKISKYEKVNISTNIRTEFKKKLLNYLFVNHQQQQKKKGKYKNHNI